jgi:predicted GIY-YIG superfamily endonuclease
MGERTGYVYLLHFVDADGRDAAYGHARHYLGFAVNLERRLAHHERGTGANLLRHAAAAGLTWRLARVWCEQTRADERRRHNGGHRTRCPICRPDMAQRLGL